jgi:hypothetical protein
MGERLRDEDNMVPRHPREVRCVYWYCLTVVSSCLAFAPLVSWKCGDEGCEESNYEERRALGRGA